MGLRNYGFKTSIQHTCKFDFKTSPWASAWGRTWAAVPCGDMILLRSCFWSLDGPSPLPRNPWLLIVHYLKWNKSWLSFPILDLIHVNITDNVCNYDTYFCAFTATWSFWFKTFMTHQIKIYFHIKFFHFRIKKKEKEGPLIENLLS